jgi:GntR family transcriptional regulator
MAPELAVRIDLSAPVPVYRQIASGVRIHLVAGDFHPGEALPTVRQLALGLGINHNTVAEAYRLLAQEGWLELRRGEGAIVLDRPQPRAESGEVEAFARRLRELVAEGRARGLSAEALCAELRMVGEALGDREG